MKKILILILITVLPVILFFYLQKENINEEKNKIIKNTSPKKTVLDKKPTVEKSKPHTVKKEVNKKSKEINLDPNLVIDRENFYINQKYEKPVSIEDVNIKKKKDLEIDFDVDIDKKKKDVDGLEMNIEKKF